MSGTYKKIEIVGTSTVSFAEAVKAGVAEAAKTVHDMSWFEVTEMHGHIKDGKVSEFQAVIKIGFKVDH